jgi:hypothetical protein
MSATQVTANSTTASGFFNTSSQAQLRQSGNWAGTPGAPTIGTASVVGPTSVSITFTAPASNGGFAITSYTVTSSPGNITSTGSSSPITVTGLTTGTTYTFTVTATNSLGAGPASSASNSAIPSITMDYLVVAGGGGGGMTPPQGYGSGGGAGGLLTASNIGISSGITYTITVGAGGTRATYGGTIPTIGGNSIISGSGFSTVTSIGGGRGSTNGENGGGNGGSGGGGGKSSLAGKGVYPGSTYIDAPRQGYDGGNGDGTYGGAGGGAGAAGGSGSSAAGGIGLSSSITGTATYYAGGGGGGDSGLGGLGGGGSSISENGVANTGGGGAASPGASTYSGTGGSGVVILRFPSSITVSTTTGSPTITTDGSFKVYKYTASGSITF